MFCGARGGKREKYCFMEINLRLQEIQRLLQSCRTFLSFHQLVRIRYIIIRMTQTQFLPSPSREQTDVSIKLIALTAEVSISKKGNPFYCKLSCQ